MLSRVANNLCWLGRYLERAENTARIINVNSNLLLDLPKSISLGWEPIVDILSYRELFYSNHKEAVERNVINFMVADRKNLGSIISALSAARENARTIREIIPREAWEKINELYSYAKENCQKAQARRSRYAFLSEIIQCNQTITGILAGTMTHDEGYAFLRIGRNIERADMTTRIIDVRSASLLQETETSQSAFENLQWMSVLKSLTAYQMYRREVRLRIRRPDVLKFLLLENRFPRSLLHTLQQVEHCLKQLPNHEDVIMQIRVVENHLLEANPQSLIQEKLHDFIDDMQLGLNTIFDKINETYFYHQQ
ncbi:alpha-E domain-containing protein [Flavobacterium sp. W21_SRS_FM6]|uniref:alpha-E domain-containing protein n=1 Tax=Flavobacterium sp. W21_SRS_FM6 TaxID=3240268 RepID=UPI003F8FBECF